MNALAIPVNPVGSKAATIPTTV